MASSRNATSALVARLSRFRPLSDADEAALHALAFVPRAYEAGQYLLRDGDLPRYCTVLLRGFAYRHKFVGDGGRQIVMLCVPTDLIDSQNLLLAQSDHNVQTLTPVEVAMVESDALIDLAFARPAIGRALWHDSLVESSIAREWIANVGRRSARARTAHLLCEVAVRSERAGLGDRSAFELPMTQEQLGDALGLTAVHINRTLKALQDDGLIQRSKRSVSVRDWAELSRTADFSATYLHPAG